MCCTISSYDRMIWSCYVRLDEACTCFPTPNSKNMSQKRIGMLTGCKKNLFLWWAPVLHTSERKKNGDPNKTPSLNQQPKRGTAKIRRLRYSAVVVYHAKCAACERTFQQFTPELSNSNFSRNMFFHFYFLSTV